MSAPIYHYLCGGKTVEFSPRGDIWITDINDDGMDVSFCETASAGQKGTTNNGASVGSRDITINGAILRDLEANERLLKAAVRPLAPARLTKTVNGVGWYLDGAAARTPDIVQQQGYLPFQFKFRAFFPFWRTLERQDTLLGGLASAWFPTPVSTAGTFRISTTKKSLYTAVFNDGNTDAEFQLTFSASARVVDPTVYHMGTGRYLRLNMTLAAGEKAVVRTITGSRGCTVYDSTGTSYNGFRYLDIGSDLAMVLLPGENLLRLTAAEGRDNLTCRLSAPKGVASSV